MVWITDLADGLRKRGLTVVEVDGWKTRGARNIYPPYQALAFTKVKGILWHHTATNRAQFNGSDAPTLSLCVNGRSDLPGPLCQIVFGRTGIVYVIAAGVGNHAGAGGGFAGITQDGGNFELIGIEMESSGIAPFDWTPDQVRIAPYLGAALMDMYGVTLNIGHMEYSSTGKIDPAGWPGGMDGLRAAITKVDGAKKPTQSAPSVGKPAAEPPAPAKPAKYVPDSHWRVDKGDTLAKAAQHFGVSVTKLAKYNGIKDPNRISVGERIWPPVGADTWKVEKGDTLGGIVKWYHANGHKALTVQKLQFANGINNPATETKIGLRLQIPK
jgi:LysM repeat protein